MSGYRTLKRALGETNIERKCRVLFGVCLALLIFATFLGVERICRGLVTEVMHQAGSDAVDLALVSIHWNFWQGKPPDSAKILQFEELLDSFREDLKRARFEFAVLRLPGEQTTWLEVNKSAPAVSNIEIAVLEQLRERWKEQITDRFPARHSAVSQSKETPSGAQVSETAPLRPDSGDVPFKAIAVPQEERYYYYQPIVWTKSCVTCHGSPLAGTLPASEVEAIKA